MSLLYGLALFAAAWVFYNLFSRIEHLERELKKTKADSARALELAAEANSRPEYESEMDKIIRHRRRENAKLGIHPEP